MSVLRRGLYGMVDLPPDATPARAAALASVLLDGGARTLQLRMKDASAHLMWECGVVVCELARAREARFLVNDRLDIALALGADGVHLGQDDLPIAAARAQAPPPFLIGVSTHDHTQAMAAVAAGADYIGFGPCFTTQSKRDRWPPVGLDALALVCRDVPIPVVAIGGITLATVGAVAAAGAHAAAVIGAVNLASDPLAAAVAVSAAFYAGRPETRHG